MILCDTNVFIHAFNGNETAIEQLKTIGLEQIAMSAITLMELYQSMGNKTELGQMKKKLHYYDIVHVDSSISKIAIELIENFNLSHGLKLLMQLLARQRLFITSKTLTSCLTLIFTPFR